MDDHSMRRYVPLLIAGAALIAAACSDSTAPMRSTIDSDLAVNGGPSVSSSRGNRHDDHDSKDEDNATTVVFELRPQGGTVRVGAFILRYPANAVCDPSTSGYGPEFWTTPCETLDAPLRITAKLWKENGRTHADFSPDLRFDPRKDVLVSVKNRDIRGDRPAADWQSKYGIWSSVKVDGKRVYFNEAESNPELATVFETDRRGRATGWATRKIWHFSGYYVRSGRVCDDSSGDCSDVVDDVVDPDYLIR